MVNQSGISPEKVQTLYNKRPHLRISFQRCGLLFMHYDLLLFFRRFGLAFLRRCPISCSFFPVLRQGCRLYIFGVNAMIPYVSLLASTQDNTSALLPRLFTRKRRQTLFASHNGNGFLQAAQNLGCQRVILLGKIPENSLRITAFWGRGCTEKHIIC